jgi:hypothetical protein
VVNGSNPTCPAGTNPGLKNWSAKSCASGNGQCTTLAMWSYNPPSCSFIQSCNSSYCTSNVCTATNWNQVLCL